MNAPLRQSGVIPPYRALPIRTAKLDVQHRADGSVLIEQAYALPPLHQSLFHLFEARAAQHPERKFVAKRKALPGGAWGDWEHVTFGDGLTQARALAQGLIDRGIGPDGGLMVLSGATIEHALLMLAAHAARALFTPLSTGYSLLSSDFARLKHAVNVCRPKMIFADDGSLYARALEALDLTGIEVVTLTPVPGLATTSYADLLATAPTEAVDRSRDAIAPDTPAKVIFTSGSTGAPKGVIHTHGMLAAVVAQHDALYTHDPKSDPEPAIHLSWLPWSHVGGSNIRFADVINDGAALYIDEGRPAPGQFQESLRNLREVSPQEFNSTPLFFAYLVPEMERDPALRDTFFRRLQFISYGTASLTQDIFERLQALSVASTGERTPVTTKYGSTEAQGVTVPAWPVEQIGQIGNPFPGLKLKLTPLGDRLEMRVKGLAVTPGYLNNPEATAKAFDEEGYFCTGDAARFVDPADPEKGLVFDGRVTENFKLSSGTWVAVGPLRSALIEALGVVQDCVIAGHDRDDLRVLAWLRPSDAAAIADLPPTAAFSELSASPKLLDELEQRLRRHNAGAGGASRRVKRVQLLEHPPLGDEIAEKGYVNQREVLTRRAAFVTALYDKALPPAAVEA